MAKANAGQTMESQADALIGLLEDADESELAELHQGGVKDSKWRRVIEAFVDSGDPIKKFNLANTDLKFGAVTSGLQNAIRRGNDKYPVKVKSSKLKNVVMLVNTELVADDDETAAE